MMDEGLIIENEGRAVGVAVRVRGGFMFFSSDPDLRVLEGTVFRRQEMVARRVAEIVQAKRSSKEPAMRDTSTWSAAIDAGGGNVVRLQPRQRHTNADPESPNAA